MVLTSEQWEMLQKMGVFNGMNVDASKGADGQFTVRLSASDFTLFQANQVGVNTN